MTRRYLGDHGWDGIVPSYIMDRQRSWNRRHRIAEIQRIHGYTQAEIAEMIGRSSTLVGRIIHKARREQQNGVKPPVDRWHAEFKDIQMSELANSTLKIAKRLTAIMNKRQQND